MTQIHLEPGDELYDERLHISLKIAKLADGNVHYENAEEIDTVIDVRHRIESGVYEHFPNNSEETRQ